MAISVRSTLSEEERIFTIALDRCGTDGVEGILYHGASQQGRHFDSFLELAGNVEQAFRQMRYPGEVMKKRFFGRPQARVEFGTASGCGERRARREGAAATYLFRVKQRQNASWQGILVNKKSGERFVFRSFLELMKHLDSTAEAAGVPKPDERRQIIERYLPLALAEPQARSSVQEILPGIAICQFDREERRDTFLLRMMFFEHHGCQGILYWKEKNCQQSFRSFLELIQLMGEAVLDEEQWEESAG